MVMFANYKGVMCEAPRDLSVKLFIYGDRLIVWSYCPLNEIHQVRYGLQVKEFTESIAASVELGTCIHHAIECEGWLDLELKDLNPQGTAT
jgi:hypothetical protein